MWWETLIVALSVLAAGLWLIRLAVITLRRSPGCGCGSARCKAAAPQDTRSAPRVRELVQLEVDEVAPDGRKGTEES